MIVQTICKADIYNMLRALEAGECLSAFKEKTGGIREIDPACLWQ